MSIRKVAVALSGGIDSAVSALLLKKKGFEVCGIFMETWDEIDEQGQCIEKRDWLDAQKISKNLDIQIRKVNFVKDYWNNVFTNFLEDYKSGLTPNPDILCNRYIKFDKFFKYATKILGFDAIATGHYAKTSFGPYLENYNSMQDIHLFQAEDDFKDQTFFLCNISQVALRKTMFPVGVLKKDNVKEIAKRNGLDFLIAKKESTGICFIGKRNFQSFINEYLDLKPGNLIDIDSGQRIGKHNGLHQWTIGQRCRISGCKKPYFIARKIVETNEILIAAGTDHPSLYSRAIITTSFIPIAKSSIPENSFQCFFRFQHTKPLVGCTVYKKNNNLVIYLDKALRAVTPGQYAVFYHNKECLGGARILYATNEGFQNDAALVDCQI